MRSLSSVLLALILVMWLSLAVVVAVGSSQSLVAGGPPATFQGSLMYGVDEVTLQQGGGTLSIVLKEGKFKDLSKTDMVTSLNAAFMGTPDSLWNTYKLQGLNNGLISINFLGRQLRITLGPMPDIRVPVEEVITVTIPRSMIEGFNEPLESSFRILPPPTTRIVSLTPSSLVAGTRARIAFSGVDVGSEVYLVQGASCFGERAVVEDMSSNSTSLTFLPLRGGVFSLCFAPANTGHITQFKESITISGPEAIKSDPPQPRSMAQFFVSIYGVNMTSQDLVAMTVGSCNNMDLADIQINDLFSSPTRGGFYATAKEAGDYHICYLRDGADDYVDCGQVTVRRGSGNVIDGNHDTLVIDKDTLIATNARIGHLIITGGILSLDSHKLNVSQLSWKGGAITGPGTMSVMGDSSEIDGTDPKMIDFDLYNYGHLVLLLGDIRLVGFGSFNNLHRLTVSTLEKTAAPTLQCASHHNTLRNSKGATIVFRQEMDVFGAVVKIAVGIDNAGTLEFQGSYTTSSIYTRSTSTTIVADTSSLIISQTHLLGRVSLGEHASIALQCPHSESSCSVSAGVSVEGDAQIVRRMVDAEELVSVRTTLQKEISHLAATNERLTAELEKAKENSVASIPEAKADPSSVFVPSNGWAQHKFIHGTAH